MQGIKTEVVRFIEARASSEALKLLEDVFSEAGHAPMYAAMVKEHRSQAVAAPAAVSFATGIMKERAHHKPPRLIGFRISVTLDGTECNLHGNSLHAGPTGEPLYDHGLRSDSISMALHKLAKKALDGKYAWKGEPLAGRDALLLLKTVLFAEETASWVDQLRTDPSIVAWAEGQPVEFSLAGRYHTPDYSSFEDQLVAAYPR